MLLIGLVASLMFLYSFQSLFTRLYAAHYAGPDKAQATPVMTVCYGIFIAAASFLVGGMSFSPSWQTVLFALLNAGMLILYNASMIEGGNRGSYSFLMVCSMFGSILVPLTVSVCMLGEALTTLKVFSVVLMLLSLVLMNLPVRAVRSASKSYYGWCIALFSSNGLFGAINTLQTNVMNGAERTEMLTILYLASALAVIVNAQVQGKGRELAAGFRMGKKAGLFLLITCLSATGAANLLLYVLTLMDSGVFYTILSGAVLVLSILYSLILFKEKPTAAQLLGMAIAVGSIVLINLPA